MNVNGLQNGCEEDSIGSDTALGGSGDDADPDHDCIDLVDQCFVDKDGVVVSGGDGESESVNYMTAEEIPTVRSAGRYRVMLKTD